MTIEQTLRELASQVHSRYSAHKAIGWSWHTFRAVAAEHPDIRWRRKGEHERRKNV